MPISIKKNCKNFLYRHKYKETPWIYVCLYLLIFEMKQKLILMFSLVNYKYGPYSYIYMYLKSESKRCVKWKVTQIIYMYK